jgi:hypothetical protein
MDPYGRISVSKAGAEVEWTPFQTHYFSANLVVPEIEPGSPNL